MPRVFKNSFEPSDARVVTVTTTGSWVAVSGIDGTPDIRSAIIVNITNGVVGIQFGGTAGEPHFVIPANSTLSIEDEAQRGQLYIRQLSGSNGTVYVRAF
jgi:hypothetical protein